MNKEEFICQFICNFYATWFATHMGVDGGIPLMEDVEHNAATMWIHTVDKRNRVLDKKE